MAESVEIRHRRWTWLGCLGRPCRERTVEMGPGGAGQQRWPAPQEHGSGGAGARRRRLEHRGGGGRSTAAVRVMCGRHRGGRFFVPFSDSVFPLFCRFSFS
jgi:hypothetical protein